MTEQTAEQIVAAESKPPKLYQLPISGDYITLADVRELYVTRRQESGGFFYPARVYVTTGVSLTGCPPGHSIECESDEQALEIRDQIAAALQSTRSAN